MQMICETDLDNAGVIRYLPASGYIFKFMPLSKKKLTVKNRKRKIIKINRLKKRASAAGYYTVLPEI